MAKYYDTLIGEYLKNPGTRGLSLDKLAESYFDYKMISYDEVTGKNNLNFSEVDLLSASVYSGEDVYITNKIYEKQISDNSFTDREKKILEEIENPLLLVLKDMEITGVKIDRDRLKGIGILLEEEIKNLRKSIIDFVGEEFNINSPKQVGEILFDKLGLPRGKKTKTGYSVNAEVLGDLAHQYEVAQNIVDYRHYTKLLSTYINGLTNLLDNNDLVHTSYNQTVASTGRLSSNDPNLQNIPASHGIAGEIRDAFVSRFENGSILTADYSQVEVRLLAIMSNDENLLNAFENGLDIHNKTAEFIFGKNQINSSERKIAKAVNFGVIYGISPFGLSKMIGIIAKDAKIYIDKFYENYPKVKEFFNKIIIDCEKNGYVETYFGRKRYIGGINDKNRIIKSSAEREAINMPIQGTSADIIKIAMIRISSYLKENNFKSKMIMQVHDELVLDVTPDEKYILQLEIKKIMESVLTGFKISLKVDIGVGNSWKNAK